MIMVGFLFLGRWSSEMCFAIRKWALSNKVSQRCPLLSCPVQNVILSSQSAATVKKDTLSQPALEVQETSSQESSLESESDEEEEEEEEDDYMDI